MNRERNNTSSLRAGWASSLAVLLGGLLLAGGARADGGPMIEPPPQTGAYSAHFVESRDNITIIEFAGDYSKSLPNGAVNSEARAVVAKEFYRHHPDNYDFLVVFNTFEYDTGEALAFHLGVKNHVQGIGLPLFDNSGAFGSEGKLQGYIDMAALSRYETNPLYPRFERVLEVLAHEVLHQWGSFIKFHNPDGSLNDALLGRDESHWSYLLDSGASVGYGAKWRDNGDGSFTSVAVRKFYSPLDLYLMGMYGAHEVPPITLIENPEVDKSQLPRENVTITGTPRTITIDDIIAAEGQRVPAVDQAQKNFRFAFILLKGPDERLDDSYHVALNNIRSAFMSRFAILTGGRGLARIYPEALPTETVGAPHVIIGGELRNTAASIDEGLAWLRDRQAEQGYWNDKPATRVRDTIVSLQTLLNLDPGFADSPLAIEWLSRVESNNTDYLARQIGLLGDNPTLNTLDRLLALQNSDGGWGLAAGYDSDPQDTALALLALARAGGQATAVERGSQYLNASQNSDGGWNNVRGGPSKTGITSLVLRALKSVNRHGDVQDAALTLLASRQGGDGGFGDSPSTVYDTASALDVFMLLDQMTRIRPDEAAAYLYSQQDVNGSWGGSTYATALALSTLKRFSFPNWLVASMSAEPLQPRDGDWVRLDITVTNDSNVFAPQGVLRIFDGEPAEGGSPIGPDIVIPVMAPNTSLSFSPYWDSFDKPGTHKFVAVVDPDNTQPEMSEQDNRGAVTVEVLPAPLGAELSVIEPEIAVLPANPNVLPTTMGIAANVRNFGMSDAVNVRVVLIKHSASSERVIVDETTLDIPSRSSMVVNFTDILNTPGVTEYTVHIDPDNLISETSKSNNAATVRVETEASIDLAVAPEDISLDRNPALVGEDVIFTVRLHNRGTQDTTTTQVQYLVTDGSETRELGTNNIQLAGGGSIEQTVTWRVDLSGDLTFTVVLDPQGLVAELDESNNQASFQFPAQTLDAPNLLVSYKDMGFVPNPANEGYPLNLSALVRNNGSQAASDVEVVFYNGDPAHGGTQIGGTQVIPSLASHGEATVSITWDPVPSAGDKLIYVVVDPDNRIIEFTRQDNAAFAVLNVLSLPDFAISASDIHLQPQFPSSSDTLAITARISNLGQQAAANVVVRAFDGDPDQGGVQFGEQTIASMAGNSFADVSFSLDLQGSRARAVVIKVNPDNLIQERFRSNNTATRLVAVQDGDIYATNLYFSPNGDNIKDTTELFFRLATQTDVEVRVINLRNEVVRRFSEGLLNVTQGSVVWDGLDDLGRLVSDGDYRLQVADGNGNVHGEVRVNLDTNRSSLLKAMGTEYELYTNLTCELPRVRSLHLADDDNTVTFQIASGRSPDADYPKGIYRMAANGGDIRVVVSESWFDAVPAELQSLNLQVNQGYPWGMYSSKDGGYVLFMRADRGPHPTFPTSTITYYSWFITDSDGNNIRHIPDSSHYNFSNFEPVFTEKGDYIYWVDAASSAAVYRLNTETFVKDTYIGPELSRLREYGIRLSPDGKYLAIYDSSWNIVLLNTTTGETSFVESDYSSFLHWAPDSQKFVVDHYPSNSTVEFHVYNTKGELTHLFPTPANIVYDYSSYAAWSSSSSEFAVRVTGYTSGGGYGYGLTETSNTDAEHPGAVFIANLITNKFTEAARLRASDYSYYYGEAASYYIYTREGSRWVDRGVLHYGHHYREQQVDLSQHLPDSDGEFKVRIRQVGKEAAHVESVALLQDGNRRIPDKAVKLSDSLYDKVLGWITAETRGEDVTEYVRYNDHEVLDLHEAEMEVIWNNVSGGQRFILALNAREEELSKLNTLPFTYEKSPGKGYRYTISGQNSLNLDGKLNPDEDRLELLFKEFTRPDTGHPSATVYGYIGSDENYLYGALDFTVDNTMDDELDWASLRVRTPNGWQEFRVTIKEQVHGVVGFVKTMNVPYTHKYYEFRIPLKDIGKQLGDEIEVSFQAYGTAAIIVGDGEGLPRYGELLWTPGERSLVYDTTMYYTGEANYAIFLDEDNRVQEIFADWRTGYLPFYVPEFSYTGRKLIFQSSLASEDPNSICYEKGLTDTWTFESLLNLVVDLRATRSDSAGGVLLRGTAADLNFDYYRLDYAYVNNLDTWYPIAPASGVQVIDGRFTTWVPPEPGNYFVRLTAYDTAGNSRSVVRRVSWGLSSSITDLYRTPEFISPNGDGVQDNLRLHYRVLEPVHLEFNIYNASGDRVRTLIRDHSLVGSEHELVWDGRNEQGTVVPDGDYRITVQNFEFYFTVDNTAPDVSLALRHLLQIADAPPEPAHYIPNPGLEWSIAEANRYDVTVEYRKSAATAWTQLDKFDRLDARNDPGEYKLPVGIYTDGVFRITVRDQAGNTSVVQTEPAKQEVVFYRIEADNVFVNTSNSLSNWNEPDFRITESVVNPVAQWYVQYKPSAGNEWLEVEVTDHLVSANNVEAAVKWTPVWDGAEGAYMMRFRLVDNTGHSFISNPATIAPPETARFLIGMNFPGVQTPAAEPNRLDSLSYFSIEPRNVDNIDVYFMSARVEVTGRDDPRYELPVTVYSRDFSEPLDLKTATNQFHQFKVLNLDTCSFYTARLDAVLKLIDKTDPNRITVSTMPLTLSRGDSTHCIGVEYKVHYQQAAQCDSPSPGQASIELVPKAYDGIALRLMTLSRQDQSGEEDVLFNVNNPQANAKYQYQIDTSGMDEGVYPYQVKLINDENVEFIETINVIVDHVAPTVAITYPQENQRLCGIPRINERGVVENYLPIEILVDDPPVIPAGSEVEDILDVGIFYSAGLSSTRTPLRILRDNLRVDTRDRMDGPASELVNINGEYTVYLEAIDAGGFKQCIQRSFYVDGKVEIAPLMADYTLFSPNGDGVLDEVTVTFTVDESVTLDIDVHQAVQDHRGYYVASGEPVRNLVVNRQELAGSADVVWDGRSNNGATVPDGHYILKFYYRDACGNLAEQGRHVIVDNTPPAVAINAPAANDALSQIVEVVGSVTDLYLLDYTLELQPEQGGSDWLKLASGTRIIDNEVLNVWNTIGLSGTYTLRLSANDAAGNANVSEVSITVPERTNLLSYLEATPRLFSPNGDNKRETTAIRLGVESDALLTIQIKDGSDNVVRTLLQDRQQAVGTLNLAWDGRNDSGMLLPDDTYIVTLRAVSTVNPALVQQETVTVVLDRTPPTIEITRPTAGFVSGEGAILGTIADEHLAGYSLSLTGTPEQPDWTVLAEGGNNRYDAVLAELDNLAEGQYALKIEAVDEGEIASELVIPFEVDNTPPQVEILAPLNDSFVGVGNAPVEININVTDANIKVYTLNIGAGESPETWTELISGESFPLNNPVTLLDVASYSDGVYMLQLVAEDKAGNRADTSIRINIDNTPPLAEISSPSADNFIKHPTAILGTASDINFRDYRLQIAPGDLQSAIAWNDLGGGTVDVVDAQLLEWLALPPDGPYILRLLVADAADNKSEYKLPIYVDTTPPVAPTGLTATVESQQNVQLTWDANSEADVVGYHVYRDGVPLTTTPVPHPEYLDSGVGEGLYRYTVKAIDHAEWLSEPSNSAEVLIDLTPPTTRIHLPADGNVVSSLIDIRGTAFSQDDFKEYRLYAGAGAEPDGWQLLRRSPVPVLADVLSEWNTVVLAEGAVYTLKLEAEDIRGNVGIDNVTVTIDNLPPAAPTGLVAVPNGSDVNLTWNANTEDDLLGYLVFRNERIANVEGIVVGDLRPYAVINTAYPDLTLPDGLYSYTIIAIDAAGNLSDPSLPSEVLIDTRPPQAFIVLPEDGSRFETLQYVLAVSEDTDVAQVQFQYKAASDSTWLDLGIADSTAPYAVDFDPVSLGLVYGNYQLRAVATDLGGKTDPSPASITVTYIDVTRPAAVAGLATRVTGGDVNLSWQANSENDLAGYLIDRTDQAGNTIRITESPIAETQYTDPGLGDQVYRYTLYAVDTSDNVSDPSNEREAVVYTPLLIQPYTPIQGAGPIQLEGQGITRATLSGTVTTGLGTTDLPTLETDASGLFMLGDLGLEAGHNHFTIRLTDTQGNVSKDAAVNVVSGAAPARPTGLLATATDYNVDLSWDANPEANIAGYRVFRNGESLIPEVAVSGLVASASETVHLATRIVDNNTTTYWPIYTTSDLATRKPWVSLTLPEPRLISSLEVEWRFLDYRVLDYDVQAWTGDNWVTVQQVRDTEDQINRVSLSTAYYTNQLRLVFLRALRTEQQYWEPVRLSEVRVRALGLNLLPSHTDSTADGHHSYTVTAINALGFESIPSEPATLAVGDVIPPEPVSLTATADGSDVLLAWTPSSSDDVVRYNLYRDNELLATHSNLADLNYTDAGLPNGAYAYIVRAVDAAGNISEPSNTAEATVSILLLPAPVNLTVTVVPEGRALDLSWQAAAGPAPAGYRVLRSLTASGPYTVVAELTETVMRDSGLTNGLRYFYVIQALDALGNPGNLSNEASGIPQDTVAPKVGLYYPATPDLPYTSKYEFTAIVGESEPGAAVSLYEKGAVERNATANQATLMSAFSIANYYRDASLSPNGRYAVMTDHNSRVHLVDMEASYSEEVIRIERYSADARWFSDSKAFIFTDRDYNTGNYFIRKYDIETQEVTNVTDPADAYIQYAVVSPDGARIAATGYINNRWRVSIFDLANNTWSDLLDSSNVESLAWSSDSRYIAYNQYNSATRTWNIEYVDVNSGNIVIVDQQVDAYITPDWSSDSNSLVYIRSIGGYRHVWRHDIDSGVTRGITSGNLNHADPRWLHDNKSVVYMQGSNAIIRHDMENNSAKTLYAVNQSYIYRLQRVATGYLAFFDGNNQEYLRLDPAGRFAFPSVQLDVGDNMYTATAMDEAGNVSAHSEPVNIIYDLTDRADLVVTESDINILPTAPIVNQSARITVTVHNLGAAASGETTLTLYAVGPSGSQTLIDQGRLPGIAAGGRTSLAADWLPVDPGRYTIVAVADPRNLVLETSELNNVAIKERLVAGSANPQLEVVTDKSSYTSNEAVVATLTLHNPGDSFNGNLEVRIEDSQGYPVTMIHSGPVANLGYSEQRTIAAHWNTGQVFAGGYQVAAYLYTQDGSLVADSRSTFSIGAVTGISSSVASDKSSYTANTDVQINGTILFSDGNTLLSGAEALLRIVDSNASVMAETRHNLGSMLPGSNAGVALDWNTGLSALGEYFIELDVIQDQLLISQARGRFTIESGPTELDGALQLSTAAPAVGEPQTVSYTVTNVGNNVLNQLPVRISLVDSGLQSVIELREANLDLQPGLSAGSAVVFNTSGLSLKTYTVVLQADISDDADGQWVTLATAGFPLQDREAPTVEIRQPQNNSHLRGDALAVIAARDTLSTITAVEVNLNGSSIWQSALINDPSNGLYQLPLLGLAEGLHIIQARATDAWDNQGVSEVHSFIVDNTPPLINVSGIADAGMYNQPVTPVVEIIELYSDTSYVSLNGSAFISGTTVEAEGEYTFNVVATDLAGNRSVTILNYAIDTTPPVVIIEGVQGGAYYNTPVIPLISVTDQYLESVEITLNGETYVSGTEINVDGAYMLSVSARDLAGNTTESSVGFVLDTVAPVITISGVEHLGLYNAAVTPVVSVDDANLASFSLFLNGADFVSGTSVEEEGEHRLFVTASDQAGNTSSVVVDFEVDVTAPFILVSGVSDGGLYNVDISPEILVTDKNLAGYTVTLNNQPFNEGAVVSEEGLYVLSIRAADKAGNESNSMIRFEIDKTPPVVQIEAPVDGQRVQHGNINAVGHTEPFAAVFLTIAGSTYSTQADLIGRFTFEQIALNPGLNTLQFHAVDRASNIGPNTVITVVFEQGGYLSGEIRAAGGTLIWSPERQNQCMQNNRSKGKRKDKGHNKGHKPGDRGNNNDVCHAHSKNEIAGHETENLLPLIVSAIKPDERYLLVHNQDEFVTALRSQKYGSIILIELHSADDICRGGENAVSKDRECAAGNGVEKLKIDRSIQDEIRAMVASGSGLTWIKTHPDNNEHWQSLFGVKINGVLPNVERINVPLGLLKTGQTVDYEGWALKVDEADAAVLGIFQPQSRPALTQHHYGDGQAILINFNPAHIHQNDIARNIIRAVMDRALPKNVELFTDRVVEVEWKADNLPVGTSVLFTEELDPQMNFIEAIAGDVNENRTTAKWSDIFAGDTLKFTALVGLPSVPGNFEIKGKLERVDSDFRNTLEEKVLYLDVIRDNIEYSSRIMERMALVSWRNKDRKKVDRVYTKVHSAITRNIDSAESAVASIIELTDAIDLLTDTDADTVSIQADIGRLIRMYQAHWITYQ